MWKLIERLIKFIMTPIFRIIGVEMNDEKWDSFMQFVKFCFVGLSSAIVTYIVNVLTLLILKNTNLTYDYVIANIAAFIISVLWSYMLNSKFVFHEQEGEHRSPWKTLLKTYISYGITGLILTNILSYLWIDVIGISKFIAPVINVIICVPINFVLNKLWAYKTDNATY